MTVAMFPEKKEKGKKYVRFADCSQIPILRWKTALDTWSYLALRNHGNITGQLQSVKCHQHSNKI